MNSKEFNKVWNHIEALNKEMGTLANRQVEIKTDVKWLKKFQWLILSTALGGVVLSLIGLSFRLLLGI